MRPMHEWPQPASTITKAVSTRFAKAEGLGCRVVAVAHDEAYTAAVAHRTQMH